MNILATVPGQVPLPLKYRTAGPTCDHCGFNRNRKDTYVLRHDDGRYVQVGPPVHQGLHQGKSC